MLHSVLAGGQLDAYKEDLKARSSPVTEQPATGMKWYAAVEP